jgi:thiol-disulfide isomerase/thioredoxin
VHYLFDMSRFCLALIFASAFCIPVDATQSADEDETRMTIGSKAPDLDIEYWLSDNDGMFQHATKIEADNVYVIEFWASRNIPSIIAMPHLAKLQTKYRDEVQIIGVSAEDLDRVEDFLERRVLRDKEKRTYAELTNSFCLTSDPDESVKNDYFRAAGQISTPAAFIVGKTGLVEWIGHPMRMDEPLESVINDQWNRDKFLVEYNEAQEKRQKVQEARRKRDEAMGLIREALVDGGEDEAIELIDKMLKDETMPDAKAHLGVMRLQIKMAKAMRAIRDLVGDADEEGAIELIDEMLQSEDMSDLKAPLQAKRLQLMIELGHEESAAALSEFTDANQANARALNDVAWRIYEQHESKGDIDNDVLAAAKKAAEYAAKAEPKSGAILDTLAHLIYVVDQDLDRAIEIQKKAVEHAGPQLRELHSFLNQLKKEKETGKKPKKKKTESDF